MAILFNPFLHHYLGLYLKDSPNHEDALAVLLEISSEIGSSPLNEETRSIVLACWRMIQDALFQDEYQSDFLTSLKGNRCIPNVQNLLEPPEWVFFENRAGLASKFGDLLKNNVINRQIGSAKAMELAGVRSLSSAVEVELLECENPTIDANIKALVLDRRNQLGRVLDSHFEGETSRALDRLETISFENTDLLIVRYSLDVFNQHRKSDPEEVPALYMQEQNRLFFVHRNGQQPWAAMARELAIALFPETDPGKIASPLKEVIAADSPSIAENTLDELGFARLDTTISSSPQVQTTQGLGVDIPIPEDSSESAEDSDNPSLTAVEAIEQILGHGSTPTPPPADLPTEYAASGGLTTSNVGHGASTTQGKSVLRSYLPAPKTNTREGDDEKTQSRSQVDQAGIKHVLEYEVQRQRVPKEMPHSNPGYDIESYDSSGNLIRLIEVKSFSGRWYDTYAVLSRPQFDQGASSGDLFWLYVVEYADSDTYKIYPVRNPVTQANHFMFDDGWRALAETEAPSETEPQEETEEE